MLAPITAALRAALEEAFEAASSLVPAAVRPQFVLVGSAALLYHRGTHKAADLDIVGTSVALFAFFEGAQKDARFSVMHAGGRVEDPFLLPYFVKAHS
jgi:hypothetical protein